MNLTYDILVLTHPNYFKYLEDLLNSLNPNEADSVQLLAVSTSNNDYQQLKPILKRFPKVNSVITKENKTIANGRNDLTRYSNSSWCVFLDSDIVLDSEYFDSLHHALGKVSEKVQAIAGGISIYEASSLGFWEAYTDMSIYLHGISGASFDGSLDKFSDLEQKMLEFENLPTKYLQGFNQIIRNDFLQKAQGFDPKFWSAEDREIACRIRNLEGEIRFFPKVLARHRYNFSSSDIIQRKRIHGYWYTMLRKQYPSEKLIPQLTFPRIKHLLSNIVNPPEPYSQSQEGIRYLRIASLAYLGGLTEGAIRDFAFDEGWNYGS